MRDEWSVISPNEAKIAALMKRLAVFETSFGNHGSDSTALVTDFTSSTEKVPGMDNLYAWRIKRADSDEVTWKGKN